jgi:TolA-binding protein
MTKLKIQNKFQIQISKPDILSFGICVLVLFWHLNFGICHLFAAQEDNKLVILSKQIIEAKTITDLYRPFSELKDLYFKENKFSDFVDFLESLKTKKDALQSFTNYYIALSRYQQLKYLEETQNWDEYFSKGNDYRDQITENAAKTIATVAAQEPLHLYASLILWQFHCDQQDAFQESALTELMNSALEYAQGATDMIPIKNVADQFAVYGEKGKSKELYKIYVDKLITSEIKVEELDNTALEFYKQGNLELSEAVYDVYIGKVVAYPKEEAIPILIEIAKSFTYKDEGLKDAFYAEKVFKKIEELGKEEVFNEELIYLRAFNLEKAKEYAQAKDAYLNLVQRFPDSAYADEADFKTAIIYTYILRDLKNGKACFKKLSQKKTLTPQGIASLYHLGLLSQWEENFSASREYYQKFIEEAKEGFPETAGLAQERMKEIEKAKPIEYNLKTFLDLSLKDESTMYDMSRVDLKASLYRVSKGQELNIAASVYLPQTGCLQMEVQYFWSGDLGKTKPAFDEASFNTSFTDPGTKVINLVVISPSGVLDRGIDLINVH